MALMLRLYLFTFIYLTVTDCRLLPITKPPAVEKKHARVLPQDFLQNGKGLVSSMKIPNSEFCSEMILKPEDHYLVLPWWYNYCQDLREKHAKGIQGNVNYNDVHKYMVAEIQLFKKRLNDKNFKRSELEKELMALNNDM